MPPSSLEEKRYEEFRAAREHGGDEIVELLRRRSLRVREGLALPRGEEAEISLERQKFGTDAAQQFIERAGAAHDAHRAERLNEAGVALLVRTYALVVRTVLWMEDDAEEAQGDGDGLLINVTGIEFADEHVTAQHGLKGQRENDVSSAGNRVYPGS